MMFSSLASGKNNDSVDLNLLFRWNDANLRIQNGKCLMGQQPSLIFEPNCYLIRTVFFSFHCRFNLQCKQDILKMLRKIIQSVGIQKSHLVYWPGQSRWSWSACQFCPRRRCSPVWGPSERYSACVRTACPPGSASCNGHWWALCAQSCRPRGVQKALHLRYWGDGQDLSGKVTNPVISPAVGLTTPKPSPSPDAHHRRPNTAPVWGDEGSSWVQSLCELLPCLWRTGLERTSLHTPDPSLYETAGTLRQTSHWKKKWHITASLLCTQGNNSVAV